MKIELKEITVRELANGYKDNAEGGVTGYGGRLDIRPPYQREFIYKDKQRDAVIDTITKDFPLNVMYWAVRDDGNFEIIDGQQRTISVCQYVACEFSYKNRGFNNLQDDEQEKILNYKLMIYTCSGSDSERLDWFRIINIAGERLTDQELHNAVYAGSWVTDAKRYFSKTGCAAYGIGSDYLNGKPIRQEYLETAIKWISVDGNIEGYMAKHQHDADAKALWRYFQDVIEWVQKYFTDKEIVKGVDWGTLYNKFKGRKLDSGKIGKEAAKLIQDDDVTNQRGIYPYILTRDESYLSIRAFSDAIKLRVYKRQKGICPRCKKKRQFEIGEMEADHIKPWCEGGKTTEENCQMLCKECNRRKADR